MYIKRYNGRKEIILHNVQNEGHKLRIASVSVYIVERNFKRSGLCLLKY